MSDKTPPQYTAGSHGPQCGVVHPEGCHSAMRVWTLRKHAAPCICPKCGRTALTSLEYKTGRQTHLIALIFATFACCFIPYMSTAFKNVTHSCGSCGEKLAVWHASGRLEILAHDPVMPGVPAPAPQLVHDL